MVAGLLGVLASAASAATIKIDLYPGDVGSGSGSVFTTLPTDDPSVFGLFGDVRKVNFDTTPDGAAIAPGSSLNNEYASIGVTMNNIYVKTAVYGGPASPPNATFYDQGHIFNFTIPVKAVGVINTSPDRDRVRLYTGPDGSGDLLLDFQDLGNYHVDRFVGGRVTDPGVTIGSMLVNNASGNLELDELIFETPEPATLIVIAGGLPLLLRRKRKSR